MSKSNLFSKIKIRNVVFENRIGLSPMCQYVAKDGFVNDFHLVNIGSKSFGTGFITVEATGIEKEGRITNSCLGIYKDEHIEGHTRLTDFAHKYTSGKIGIQLAHSGRKGSTAEPFAPKQGILEINEDGWTQVAPSPVPYVPAWRKPKEMTTKEIEEQIKVGWVNAVKRAKKSNYDYIMLHGAFGYLIHQFLSPISNLRTDKYGGSVENRSRYLVEIVEAVRREWEKPLFVRLSSVDYVDGGITLDDTIKVATKLRDAGVDMIDILSGGISPDSYRFPMDNVPFSEEIKKNVPGLLVSVVGSIETPKQIQEIVSQNKADVCFVAREYLKNPYFALNAATQYNRLVEYPYPHGYPIDPNHRHAPQQMQKIKEDLNSVPIN